MYAKVLTLLAVFAACSEIATADFETDLRFIDICNKTAPISLRTMNEVLINKKLTHSKNANNFKCFLHCLFAQYGWMDEEGGFELHEIKHVLQETGSLHAAQLEFVLYRCTATKSVDKCERSFEFLECFWSKTSEPEENVDNERFFYELGDVRKK